MLYFGFLSMFFITSLHMSVSFISTTIGNIICCSIINNYYVQNFDITSAEITKLSLMSISSMFIATYHMEYSSKLKMYAFNDKQSRLHQVMNLIDQTNLGIFIQKKGAIKFQNTKVANMFSTLIKDHSDNQTKLLLDKDYIYKEKFQFIPNLNTLLQRHNFKQEKPQSLSKNEIMQNLTHDGIFHFQYRKHLLSLDQIYVFKGTHISFSEEQDC